MVELHKVIVEEALKKYNRKIYVLLTSDYARTQSGKEKKNLVWSFNGYNISIQLSVQNFKINSCYQ